MVSAQIGQEGAALDVINEKLSLVEKEKSEEEKGPSLLSRMKIGVFQTFKKSVRAQNHHIDSEKHQFASIEVDLGVNLLTGREMRERIKYDFLVKD